MWGRILAAAGILGASLTAVAIIGYTTIEANAGNVPWQEEHKDDDLTGPQASCFAACAETIWEEVVPAYVVEINLKRAKAPPRPVSASLLERVYTHEDVFVPLHLAGGVAVTTECPITQDGENMTYCIRREADELTAEQVQCMRTCALAIVSPIADIDSLALNAGPPRTFEITKSAELSVHDYATAVVTPVLEGP